MNVGELSVTIKNIWFALESSQVSSQIMIKKAQKYIKIVLKIRQKKRKENTDIEQPVPSFRLGTSLSCSFQQMVDR